MKIKFANLMIAALLVFGALAVARPVSACYNERTELNGVISAIDTGANTLTITPKAGGADVVLKVDSTTVITRLFKKVSLADLQVGDRVEVRYDPSTMLASRIEAAPNLVDLMGVVTAIDTTGSTLTVIPKNGGANIVLNVDASTIIKRLGKSVTLADIQLGDKVYARYNPVTFLAASIWAMPNLVELVGLVTALDTTGNTLTVAPIKGGVNVVLNVDANTVIKRLGKVVTLADILLGDKVYAKYNPVTFLAASISAQSNLVDLVGFVSAIDATVNTLTVMPKKGGANVVLNVDANTIIKRSGQPATLAEIQLGDKVYARYNPVTFLAARIWAQPYLAELSGLVSAVDTTGGTLSVTIKNSSTPVVLKVDPTTVITRNGAAATLADIQLGDRVRAKYNLVTLLATKISAQLNLVDIKGTISAVDTTANTVSVTPKKGSPVVLNVDPNTVIMRNGAAATLADLLVADRVQAKYNPVTLLAAKIYAWQAPVSKKPIGHK